MASTGRPVSFWLRFEDISTIDAAVAAAGMTRSAWVKQVLLSAATAPDPASPNAPHLD